MDEQPKDKCIIGVHLLCFEKGCLAVLHVYQNAGLGLRYTQLS